MSGSGGVIRKFGNWELFIVDLASGEKAYFNRVSKEVVEDPPEEVLAVLEAENKQRRLPVYEPTSFHFLPLKGDSVPCACCGGSGSVEFIGCCPLCDGAGFLAGEDPPAIERLDLLKQDGCAFLLRHLLSEAECREVIEQAEEHGLRNCGVSRRIRITDRVSIMGYDLATILFERARPYLSPIEVSRSSSGERLPAGIRDDAKPGTWIPVGLNPCFRVCKYDPGGFFLPHRDGGFEYDRTTMSLKTFMMYLNDDFEGAPTNFYEESQRCYVQPDPDKVVHSLCPESGACVVFNHCLVHDGGKLQSGVKYLLRTEVMYSLRGSDVLDDDDPDDSDFDDDGFE